MILNFGSINIDHVYGMDRLPLPGETVPANTYGQFLGGKGINQSIAAHHSGGEVLHFGAVGSDGQWVLDQIQTFGLSTDHIRRTDQPTGNAVVSVDGLGENSIVILAGANHQLDKEYIDNSLSKHCSRQDYVDETVLSEPCNKVSD